MTARSRAKSREAWTRDLTTRECVRRGWILYHTTWTERFPRKDGLITITRDLFGCVDALAWPSTQGGVTYAIQFTGGTGGNRAKRRANLEEHMRTELGQRQRRAGWEFLVWTWRLQGSEAKLVEDKL